MRGRRALSGAAAPASTRRRSLLAQHLNPWPGLASCASGEVLVQRIESYATSFSIVSCLVCATSAAALASPPLAASASGGHSVESGSSKALPPSLDVGSHSPPTDAGREASSRRPHAASLLVACGVPEALLEDL